MFKPRPTHRSYYVTQPQNGPSAWEYGFELDLHNALQLPVRRVEGIGLRCELDLRPIKAKIPIPAYDSTFYFNPNTGTNVYPYMNSRIGTRRSSVSSPTSTTLAPLRLHAGLGAPVGSVHRRQHLWIWHRRYEQSGVGRQLQLRPLPARLRNGVEHYAKRGHIRAGAQPDKLCVRFLQRHHRQPLQHAARVLRHHGEHRLSTRLLALACGAAATSIRSSQRAYARR